VDGPRCELNGEHRAGLETPHGDDSAPVHIEEQAQHVAVFSDQTDCNPIGQQSITRDLCLVPSLKHRAGLEAPFGEASAPVHIEDQCSDHTAEHRVGLENPHGDDSAPVHTEEQAQHVVFSDQTDCNPSGQQSITRDLCSVPSVKHRAGLEAPLGEASAPVHFEEHSHHHCFKSQAAATSERRLIEAPNLLVYHRKKKHTKSLVEIAEETMENNTIPALQMEGVDPVTAKKEVFLKQIVKEVSGILPAPANPTPKPIISKRSTVVSLRRSRRIAGMGAEIGKQDLSSRATKKVMKALKVVGELEEIDQQTRKDYEKIFSERLPLNHIEALAAFFGWKVPDELRAEAPSHSVAAC
jgi:hypothetical protein